jgi:hypothetical protein
MRKIRTRILVGAAVATFAGAAAFAAVNTTNEATAANTVALTTTSNTTANSITANTTVTSKAATSLSIEVGKSTIQAGRLDVIKGTLATGSDPSGRRIVELYRYDSKTKKWIPARVNLTRKGGVVRFWIRPLTTAEYELVYHGSAKLAASHSSPVTITVTT